ncbi:MAG: adenosine deaminase [Saprospiraceae bacterium]|nr:adenosine deaminase [Saprospiraceae bacterium]
MSSALPKIELHVHLDCSLSSTVVHRLRPDIGFERYRQTFVAPPKCTDLRDYLTRALKGIELMQTAEALRLVTLDLFDQLQADNVLYAEIRFAPLEHLRGGLAPEQVVQTVADAVREGTARTGIPAGLLLCTLRHYAEAQSLDTARLAERFAVAGFDIAGDEAGYPVDNHIAAFRHAHAKGIPCTAHAGEALGADSIWETLRHFAPRRIGHGVRCTEDPALVDYLKKRRIHLEVCPTSNVQTNVYPTMAGHRVDDLYRSGLSLSINSDARTISDATLNGEYQALRDVFGWDDRHFLHCNLEAVEHAFAPEALKAGLRQRLRQAFEHPGPVRR